MEVSALCFQYLHDLCVQLVSAPDAREWGIDCSAELHNKCCIGRTASIKYQIQSDNNLSLFLSLFTLGALFSFYSLANLMQREFR